MPGDYSRRLFRKNKHYSGVLMQQGRVQLDADWNEQLDLQLYRTETESIDVIGRCGVPRKNGGFEIGSTADRRNLTISAGRIYVDGLLCELEGASTYVTQPYLPNPEFTTVITSPPTSPPGPTRRLNLPNGRYVVFLDAWQRERTALDDPLIREVALGGPDTTTRLQNVWQVKLVQVTESSPPSSPPSEGFGCKSRFAEYERITAPSTGTLNAQTAPPKPEEDPCLLPPTSGYSRLENQLYRVEIQKDSKLAAGGRPLTFKWSRENASVETTVVSIANEVATVKETGKDELLSFGNGQWVELVDEESTLKANPRALVQIDKVNPATREITFKTSLASFKSLLPGLKLRRWDQTIDADQNGVSAAAGVWTDLEAGVQVQFAPGIYHAGDYWLIPARTITREIQWPPFQIPNRNPIPQPPRGVRHHFCRLALLEVLSGVLRVKDCRTTFPPLTELLDFFHVGGTGQQAQPGERLPCPLEVGVTNGRLPVAGARVRFTVAPEAGTLHSIGNSGRSVIVETDDDGVAQCAWQLGIPQQRVRCLQVEAALFDDEGNPLVPALHFNANFSASAEDPGIRVKEILSLADQKPLVNDSLVAVSRLQKGLLINCDQVLAPNAGGGAPPPPAIRESAVAGKPTCFVTLDLPYPIGSDTSFWRESSQIIGFQPLILGGQVSIQEQRMLWSPTSEANEWLQRLLFPVLQQRQIVDRVMAHLTIKGNFIFSRESSKVNLDAEAFGAPRDDDRIDLDLPSGDKRRGGDLEMWFWLIPAQITGLNLTATAVPSPAGALGSIRGTLADSAGAAVPGAAINLTGPIGTRVTTTDAGGVFNFPGLQRGSYKVSVQVGALTAEQTVILP